MARLSSPSPGEVTNADLGPEHWPFLDDEQLLLCSWHQRQIAQGQHLSHRCSSWRPPQHQQQGWAPELG